MPPADERQSEHQEETLAQRDARLRQEMKVQPNAQSRQQTEPRQQAQDQPQQQTQPQQETQSQPQQQSQAQQEAQREQQRQPTEAGAAPPAWLGDAGTQPDQMRGRGQTPERAQARAPGGQVLGVRPISRGDDLAIEAQRLNVEDLNLEWKANDGVGRVSIMAKSMELELHLHANLENAVGIFETTRRDDAQAVMRSRQSGATSQWKQQADQQEQAGQPQQAGQGEGGESAGGGASHDGGAHSAGERAKQLARSSGAVAVAGAVAALVGSRAHLPTRKHGVRDHRLSARRHSAAGDLVSRAADMSGDAAKAVRRRLG